VDGIVAHLVHSMDAAHMITRSPAHRPTPAASTTRIFSMKNLLMSAYDMKINQITGPAWIDSERYDVVATVPTGATK